MSAPARKHLRVACRLPVTIKELHTGAQVSGVTFNLSCGGLQAFMGLPFADGARVLVRLQVEHEHLALEGTIVRQGRSEDGLVAVAFTEVGKHELAHLREATLRRAFVQMRAIGEFPAFWELSDLDLLALAAVCHDLRLEAGAALPRHGDEALSVFLVRRGAVQLRPIGAGIGGGSSDSELDVARAGQIFGEAAAMLGLRNELEVVALEPSELLALPRAALVYLREQHAPLAVTIYETLARVMSRRMHRLGLRLQAPISF